MFDQILQTASLLGHVIEDRSFEGLSPAHFTAELVEATKTPQYKEGGFFVFSNLNAGNYTLRIFGEQFQTEEFAVVVPSTTPPLLDAPGDDELCVVIRALDNAATKINFDPTFLPQPIKAGAAVVAAAFNGTLAAPLDAGKAASAKLNDLAGLSVGDIVRIIRGKSIRLRYGPYSQLPPDFTRVVGKVVFKDVPTFALAGAAIRLTEVNGAGVSIETVAGVKIITTQINGKKVVLGAERDTTTRTNPNGDYNLYFSQTGITSITLEAKLAGFQTATKTLSITAKARHRADFELLKV
ncbi:MAG TPA: hypothetical protein VF553_19060 [Pyrinomonadaceae bacterium]|jgi:hypothetical protein